MAGAQPANGANIKVDGCGIDWCGGRGMSTGVCGQAVKKRMLHSFEIGCDGRNSCDGCVGGAASILAQPDSAAHSCIL
jgi:hypothetical protein